MVDRENILFHKKVLWLSKLEDFIQYSKLQDFKMYRFVSFDMLHINLLLLDLAAALLWKSRKDDSPYCALIDIIRHPHFIEKNI